MRELTKLEKAIVFLDSIEGLEYKYKKFSSIIITAKF